MNSKIRLEEIFSSRGATSIIKLLVKREEINVTALCRLTGLSHKQVEKYLKRLVSYGLVKEKRFGKIRIFALNGSNKYVSILREFVKNWESQSFHQ